MKWKLQNEKKLSFIFLFFFFSREQYTYIISYNSTKHMRHFTMQVKIKIPTNPTAEELNIKSNEVFKILMAIATFQVHCAEILNKKKNQLIFNRTLWNCQAPGQQDEFLGDEPRRLKVKLSNWTDLFWWTGDANPRILKSAHRLIVLVWTQQWATDWSELIKNRRKFKSVSTQISSWLCILFLTVTDASEKGARIPYHTYVQ